jgi:4-amino-4-deoxy-L-arabinose transferase-like glycosyltransferase
MRLGDRRRRWLTGAAMAAIALGIFSWAMRAPLNHDENMYVAAGVLSKDHRLYGGFAYLQMPYLPYVYRAVFEVTATTRYLLWARLLSFGFACALALAVGLAARRITRSTGFALSSTAALLCADPMLRVIPLAWNHVLSLALCCLALLLCLQSLEGGRPIRRGDGRRLWLAGLALGVAAGTKLTYAPIPLPLIAVAVLYPRDEALGRRITRRLAPLLAGLGVGLAPLVLALARAGFDRLSFANLGYHALNTTWRRQTGLREGMSPLGKLSFACDGLADPADACLMAALVLAIALTIARWWRARLLGRDLATPELPACAALLAAAAAVALTPRPLLSSYVAMAVPFAALLVGACWARLEGMWRRRATVALGALGLVAVASGGRTLYGGIFTLADTGQWTPLAVHREALAIRHALGGGENPSAPVATLAPIYALEAGLSIYPELATGPFLYRVGDLLTETQRARHVATSPATVEALLARRPPSAILVGTEPEALEAPFVRYAEAHGFRRAPQAPGLYVRP